MSIYVCDDSNNIFSSSRSINQPPFTYKHMERRDSDTMTKRLILKILQETN